MGMTADDYLAQLQALLPQGPAWPRDAGATLTKLLRAMADELARVDGHAAQLIEETDPRTAAELLADWERNYGLPDACVAAAGIIRSTQERRSALVANVKMVGGQDRAFFIGLAADLGYTVTITEWRPHTTEDDSEYPVTDEPWRFVWQVNAPLNTIREQTTEDDTEMALEVWGNDLLECVISRFKPAHTHVIFSYA